ncbi:MAG: R3H domain-containing nucleic acid-binding protein [bacterium]
MLRKEEFNAKDLDEAMDIAVSKFNISSEKIFLTVLEETEENMLVEALVDINLTLEGKRYIEAILNQFNIEYKLEAKSSLDEGEITYNIFSSENSLLIGFKGRTLEALQNLVRDLLRSYSGVHQIVTIDIGGYREKRRSQLEIVATKTAKEVARTKIEVKLDAMNSFERRIIHAKLSDWRDVITQSEGQGENRAIVIKPKN